VRPAGLALAALLLAGPAGAGEAGWLPEALGSLRAEGPVRELEPGGLYGYMDGGADSLLELGFDRLWVRRYAAGGEAARDGLVVELYRMRDAPAAQGLFWQRGGRDAPGQRLWLQGRHVLVATWTPGAARAERGAGELAGLLAARLAGARPDPSLEALLALLPAQGRLAGSTRVVRGPLGLEGFYSLGEGDVLLLRRPGAGATGLLARYRDAAGRETTRLALAYATPEAARQALEHLTAHPDPYLETLERADGRLVLGDGQGTRIEATLQGARLDLALEQVAPPAP